MAMQHAMFTVRRLSAFCVDWLVIAAWGALLLVIVMALHAGQIPSPSGPWHSEVIGFLTMTAPVILYFSVSECSAAQATLGKRALGLRVSARRGGRVSVGTSLLRNCVKFAPWELGHIVANQAVFSTAGVPGWVYLPMAFSLLLPVWWVASIFVKGYAPYDVLASTQVVRVQRVPA